MDFGTHSFSSHNLFCALYPMHEMIWSKHKEE
jgi:hypothetical protein